MAWRARSRELSAFSPGDGKEEAFRKDHRPPLAINALRMGIDAHVASSQVADEGEPELLSQLHCQACSFHYPVKYDLFDSLKLSQCCSSLSS